MEDRLHDNICIRPIFASAFLCRPDLPLPDYGSDTAYMAQDVSVPLAELQQPDCLLAQARMTIRQLSQREAPQEATHRRFIETSEEVQEAFAEMTVQEKTDVMDEALRAVRSTV